MIKCKQLLELISAWRNSDYLKCQEDKSFTFENFYNWLQEKSD